jgi:hypothetical protein
MDCFSKIVRTDKIATRFRFGYKATRWDDPFQVRMCLLKRTSQPITAAHNDRLVGNVVFAVPKRTFAAPGFKG